MSRQFRLPILALCLVVAANGAADGADRFERYTADILRAAAQETPVAELTRADGVKLPALSKDQDGALLVVKTDAGGIAKLLVSWGFHKGVEKPVPVLMINRYVTYRGERGSVATASGKDVMLFPGYRFDLDLGQVVPEGFGGDLEIAPQATVRASASSQIYTAGKSLLPADDAPTERRADEPARIEDFAGEWVVEADGRWQGIWQLAVDEDGHITGTSTSDETRSSYAVEGKQGGQPHHARLVVTLANTTQTFDAYLWTKNKDRVSGTMTLSGRQFGFAAHRRDSGAAEKR